MLTFLLSKENLLTPTNWRIDEFPVIPNALEWLWHTPLYPHQFGQYINLIDIVVQKKTRIDSSDRQMNYFYCV